MAQGRINFKVAETANVASYDQPGAFDKPSMTKAAVTPAVASQKERFVVKQAQADTEMYTPGIGDVAAGKGPTDNFANQEARFKPDDIQLPGYEAEPGAFDKVLDGGVTKTFQPDGSRGGAARSDAWLTDTDKVALPEVEADAGAFDSAIAARPDANTQSAKPRFVTQPAGPEMYTDSSTDSAFGNAYKGASPMNRDNKPRFEKSGVVNMTGDPGYDK